MGCGGQHFRPCCTLTPGGCGEVCSQTLATPTAFRVSRNQCYAASSWLLPRSSSAAISVSITTTVIARKASERGAASRL